VSASVGCGLSNFFPNAYYTQIQGPHYDFTSGQNAVIPVENLSTGSTFVWEQIVPNSSAWSTVTNGGRISGQGTDTLKINNLTTADDGYKLRVLVSKNGCTDTVHAWQNGTGALTLNVIGGSSCNEITTDPVDFTGNVNTTAGFQVFTQNTGLTFAWQVKASGTNNWTSAGAGSTSGNNNLLAISNISLSDNGNQYRCIVTGGTCDDTSGVATLYVNPVTPTVDTMKTLIGDVSAPVCTNDTVTVPIFVEGGSNQVGSFSLSMNYLETELGLISDANLNPYHNAHPDLQNNGSIQAFVNNQGNGNHVIKFSWLSNNGSGITFPTSTAAFELKFVVNPVQGAIATLNSHITFDNSQMGNNEYGEAGTSAILLDDGFTDDHIVAFDSTLCTKSVSGVLRYGNSNTKTVYGPSVNVSIFNSNGILVPIANNPFNVLTPTGDYSFDGLSAGQYNLELDPNLDSYNAGGANATDALRVILGYFGVYPFSPLEAAAAETDGVPGINASDAFQIARRFTGEINVFLDPNNDELSSWVQENPAITIGANDVQQDIRVLVRGDVNGSFDPSNLNGGGVSEVTLITNDQLKITHSGQEIEIPFKTTNSLEIGAISFVINYPFDVFDITDIQLNEKVNNDELSYTIQNGRVRISWFNLTPITLNSGEALFTIKARTVENLENAWTPTISRGDETELANGLGEVLEDVTLNIPQLVLRLTTENEALKARAYPNPTRDIANMDIESTTGGELTINIFNSLGVVVKSIDTQRISNGLSQVQVPVNDLPIGQYSVQMNLKHENTVNQTVKRLMIIR
jgi:hypothetical protein